ncbi:hypothetical protein VTK26DRAFT_3503 [Humicola hyalothermophila]
MSSRDTPPARPSPSHPKPDPLRAWFEADRYRIGVPIEPQDWYYPTVADGHDGPSTRGASPIHGNARPPHHSEHQYMYVYPQAPTAHQGTASSTAVGSSAGSQQHHYPAQSASSAAGGTAVTAWVAVTPTQLERRSGNGSAGRTSSAASSNSQKKKRKKAPPAAAASKRRRSREASQKESRFGANCIP